MRTFLAVLLIAGVTLALGAFAYEAQTGQDYGVDVTQAEGEVHVAATIPTDPARLEELGLGDSVDADEVARMITTLTFLGAAHGGLTVGRLDYKCNSGPNQCSCDNRHPLDCIDIYTECKGPLHPPGEPTKPCLPGRGPDRCVCTWH